MAESKFLAIKNWSKYQPGRSGKSGWIKDYTDKEFDAEYMGLTFFQRQVLDGCQRLRGRMGRNIPNDPTFIARALHAMSTDRPHIGHAISTLLAHGFLVLSNEQDSQEHERRYKSKNKNKEIEKEKTISAETSSAPPLKAVVLLPLNSGDEFPVEDKDFKIWKESYPAVDVMQELRSMAAWLHSNPTRRKTKSGVKAFVNRWLAKAQNEPKLAQSFREKANARVEQNGTSAAVAAGVNKFLQRKNAMGAQDVPGTVTPITGNTS